MKKSIVYILISLFLMTFAVSFSSCSKEAHCPAQKNLKKTNMDSKKGGKTNLFPKGM